MFETVDNTVTICAPFEIVWSMTNDLERWPTLFTEYAAVEILEQHGNFISFRLTTVPDNDGTIWSWVSERIADKSLKTTVARRLETGPFEFMNIRWDYRPTESGVEMRWRQEFSMKQEAGLDNHAVKLRLQRTSREQMAHVKAAVEAATRTEVSTPIKDRR